MGILGKCAPTAGCIYGQVVGYYRRSYRHFWTARPSLLECSRQPRHLRSSKASSLRKQASKVNNSLCLLGVGSGRHATSSIETSEPSTLSHSDTIADSGFHRNFEPCGNRDVKGLGLAMRSRPLAESRGGYLYRLHITCGGECGTLRFQAPCRNISNNMRII